MITRRLLLSSGVAVTFLLPRQTTAAPAGAPLDRQRTPRPASPRLAENLPLVVLDPGHGGKDPGAIGVTGTYEKHVALAAAGELRRQLEATGRFRVELTRTSDVFIPLTQRVTFAQNRGASLFVSMHADALDDHAVRGASVYTLGDAASDRQSAALARRENAADRFAGPQFHNLPPEVSRILVSLVRQETRLGSARAQHSVVAALRRDVPLLQNPARHAGFMVLKAADIPSVLVEMGFMSNRQDESALRQPEHRVKVAAAMKRAVEAYFAQVTPPLRMAG